MFAPDPASAIPARRAPRSELAVRHANAGGLMRGSQGRRRPAVVVASLLAAVALSATTAAGVYQGAFGSDQAGDTGHAAAHGAALQDGGLAASTTGGGFADPAYTALNVPELLLAPEPVTTDLLDAVSIDTAAVTDLVALMMRVEPVASAHGIDLLGLDSLLIHAERLHIPVPIVASQAWDLDDVLDQVHLFEDFQAIAEDINGSAEAWAQTLEETAFVPRQGAGDGGGLERFAPASRSAARAGIAVDTAVVHDMASGFDQWLADEATEREAYAVRNMRTRMVAYSRAHGNGHLPAAALCPIPMAPHFSMRCDVIGSLTALNNAFTAHFGRSLQVSSGYRSAAQEAGIGGGRMVGRSIHGWGLAIDFGGPMTTFDSAEYQWMAANAHYFGWGNPFWARPGGSNQEPWHWEAISETAEMTGYWR